MSKIKSDNSDITIDASGSGRDIKFQANGVEKASISSSGAFTSTTIDATKLTGTIPNFTSTGIDDNADATAITIDSSENVGIGTASVSFPSGTGLEVYDSSIPRIKLANSTTGNASTDGFDIHISGSDVKFWQRENAAMSFATNGTERMQITSDGRGVSEFTTRAWCSFDGTGTVSINDSHNVSSLTDLGTGRYRVSFSTALSNSNPAAAVSGVYSGNFSVNPCLDDNPTGSRVDIRCIQEQNSSFNIVDTEKVTVMVAGD